MTRNMDTTHDKIMDILNKEFQGLTTADLSFAIGVLEAMKLHAMLDDGRITEEEYWDAIFAN